MLEEKIMKFIGKDNIPQMVALMVVNDRDFVNKIFRPVQYIGKDNNETDK
jgi:hypothetical protein